MALHEIRLGDTKVRETLTGRATVDAIKEYAIQEQGMNTLKQSALALVEEGVTTVEELLRVSYYE